MGAETCTDGVEDDIAAELDQVPVALHEHGVKTALEEMSIDLVPSVEPLSVEAVQAVHADR
jgi:hypothetical protein